MQDRRDFVQSDMDWHCSGSRSRGRGREDDQAEDGKMT